MELLRLRDAQKEFGISTYTLYRWHWAKKFPFLFCKVGGVLFLDAVELKRIAEQSRKPQVGN